MSVFKRNKTAELNDENSMAFDIYAEKVTRPASDGQTKKYRILAIAVLCAIAVCAAAFQLISRVIVPNIRYHNAVELMEAGEYKSAIAAFEALNGYKDAEAQIENCYTGIKDQAYEYAAGLMNSGDYASAIAAFEAMDGYRDAEVQIEKCWTGLKDEAYASAVALMDNGDYASAISVFEALDGYKDSEEQLALAREKYGIALLSEAKVGDTVTFGRYEQDYNATDGKENIEWRVLAKEGDRILVISKYALESQPYNTNYEIVTWETCTLRKWLNEKFLYSAFTELERACIATSTVTADKNPKYGTDPGKDTQDRVFLLSIEEAEQYFDSDYDRRCVPTLYAEINGAWSNIENTVNDMAACWWWLRSPGYNNIHVAGVSSGGEIRCYGDRVDATVDVAVRPALWINLDS